MNYKIKTIGKGSPKIAIVGCVHGDEIMGQKVIRELKKIKLKKGSLTFIIANPKALAKKKRFIKKDLNRCFPGRKKGNFEEKLACELNKILKSFDLVIDVHATNSDLGKIIGITKLDNKMKQFLKLIPIKNVALFSKKLFGSGELIRSAKPGVTFDYGPNKSGKNYKKALTDLKIILRNLGFISGKKKIFKMKNFYRFFGSYNVPKNFTQNKQLKELQLIRKGQLIGSANKKNIYSNKTFYPLFLGKGSYEKTLSLMAKEEKIKL